MNIINKIIFLSGIVGLLYVTIIIFSDVNEFYAELQTFRIEFLPLILSLHLTALFLRGVRQHFLMNKMGIKLQLKENIKIHFSGLLLIFTPAATGEFVRTHFFKSRYKIPLTTTIPEIFFERYLDFLSLVLILGTMLFFTEFIEAQILVIPMSIVLLGLFIIIKNKKLYYKIFPKFSRFKKFKSISESKEDVFNSITILTNKKTFSVSLIITIISYLVDAISTYFVFVAFDFKIDYVLTNLMLYTSVLFGAISFLPGGFGVTEGGLLSMLTNYGMTLAKASALVLTIRLSSIWFTQFIGFTFFKSIPWKKYEND